MGYRSNFKLSVSDKGKKIIDEKLKKWIAKSEDEELEMPYKWEFKDDIEKHYILSGEYLKMYEEYEEIKALYDCKNEMYKNDIGYSYVRLGEEIEDMEEENNFPLEDDVIEVFITREIRIDF